MARPGITFAGPEGGLAPANVYYPETVLERSMKERFLMPVLIIAFGAISIAAQPGCTKEQVCLTVVSQHWMTETELNRLSPGLRMSAVRFRLTNKGVNEIVYLTWFDSAVPSIGYKLVKTKEDPEFDPAKSERNVRNLQSQFGNGSRYLRLPPNAFLEFDVPDWGNPAKDDDHTEHAFSIFIKFGGPDGSDQPTELISESFRPLKKS